MSGHFRETITALFDAPANFDAWSLNQALNVRIPLRHITTIISVVFFFIAR